MITVFNQSLVHLEQSITTVLQRRPWTRAGGVQRGQMDQHWLILMLALEDGYITAQTARVHIGRLRLAVENCNIPDDPPTPLSDGQRQRAHWQLIENRLRRWEGELNKREGLY